MNVTITPGALNGTVQAPPSKSYAHRLLIAAALSGGGSVSGIAESEDIAATLDCLCSLGVSFSKNGNTVLFGGKDQPTKAVFPCRESGSTLRFLLPLALLMGKKVTFTGTERLIGRGIGVYENLFKEKGFSFQTGLTEITFSGRISAGNYTIPGNISSQFATGLLFALPLCAGESRLEILPPVESRPYLDITLAVLKMFGITVTETVPNTFVIPGNQSYSKIKTTVEGDWSNAAALLAFGEIGGKVSVTGLNPDSRQGDKICLPYFDRLRQENAEIDLADCPDLAPVLFALAAARGKGATFLNTRRLRIKESDRAGAMAQELFKFSIACRVEENRVIIEPGTPQKPTGPLDSHNDHRIVMALCLLCSITGGTVLDAGAVRKSFPDFFEILNQMGLEARYDAG